MRLFNSARKYHELTKYDFNKVIFAYREFTSRNQPETSKEYADQPTVNLSFETKMPTASLEDSFRTAQRLASFRQLSNEALTLEQLSALLQMTNGVTAIREFPTRKVVLRAAPSASGLYPTEIYLVVNQVEGLEKGIYYFSVEKNQLIRLKKGDFREDFYRAGFSLSFLKQAPVLLVFTSVFGRNSWKFKERAYRYCLMDAGYVGENLAVGASGMGLTANFVGDFVDEEINRLLGIDGFSEAAVMLAALGKDGGDLQRESYQFGMITPAQDDIDEENMSLLRGIHLKSAHFFPSDELVNVKVVFPFEKQPPTTAAKGKLLPLPGKAEKLTEETWHIIRRRRSAHNFLRIPIPAAHLNTILTRLNYVPVLYNYPAFKTHIVINDVTGLESGIYRYHPKTHRLEVVREGNFRGDISYLTLAQDAVFNASVVLFFSVSFDEIDLFANRGYRYAHFNVGMLSESVYLTATALGLGARGIGNFFDDSLNTFFKLREPTENVLGGVIIGYA